MNSEMIGYTVERVQYWGNNIFTIILVSKEKELGINLVDCFFIKDDGIIGKVIDDYKVQELGMVHIFITQKLSIDPSKFNSLWLISENKDGKKQFLFNAAFKVMVISTNIDLYNSISEDKY
jgi:hypothetical protein